MSRFRGHLDSSAERGRTHTRIRDPFHTARVSLLPVASGLSIGACPENHTKHDAVRSARAPSTILDGALLPGACSEIRTNHDAVRSARASSTIFDDAMLQAARRPQGMWRQEAPAPRRCSGRMPFVRGAAQSVAQEVPALPGCKGRLSSVREAARPRRAGGSGRQHGHRRVLRFGLRRVGAGAGN